MCALSTTGPPASLTRASSLLACCLSCPRSSNTNKLLRPPPPAPQALLRNVYLSAPGAQEDAALLARYVTRWAARIRGQLLLCLLALLLLYAQGAGRHAGSFRCAGSLVS